MPIFILITIWIAICLVSITIGQYHIALVDIFKIAIYELNDDVAKSVIVDIRIPRILLSSLCGGVLALSGLCLQAVFRNPLVGPHIVGVSTAAALGGAICILFGYSAIYLIGFAFSFGLIALGMLFFMAKFISRSDIFALILSGIVINGFFAALVSLVQYLADAEEVLPNIVYWLLGSFVSASYDKIVLLAIVSLPCVVLLIMLRWRMNLLSLEDGDLKVLGINAILFRSSVLVLCTFLISAQVSVSGNIGWVGLVIPHIARAITGSNHTKSIPASFVIGAIFMLLIDGLSRSIGNNEIPLGILTALIGSPMFAILLKRSSKSAK